MADPYVREIGRVEDIDGYQVVIGVDYDAVSVHSFGKVARLAGAQAEEFAQLLVSAVWQAGQQKARMDSEALVTGTTNVWPRPDGEPDA